MVRPESNEREGTVPLWVNMIQVIDGDSRIGIIHRTLYRIEIYGLFDTSDCFESIHRSEGFACGTAEAMRLGKPGTVTKVTGNPNVALKGDSSPLDAHLIPVKEGQCPFCYGPQWTDADIGNTASHMTNLCCN